jgi:glycosyltransferase involved in cell wall biosynthesis
MKNVYYWCPFIGKIATIKAVINSANSLVKYSKKKFVPTIINSCGEWDKFNFSLLERNIKIKKLENFFKINTNTSGYLKSRITYIKIFVSCFFLLRDTLKKDQPEYLVAHLITSLPIFLYLIFQFKTKLIVRVSGKVKMNFLRKLLWKMSKKNITLITCPTKETQKYFINLNLIEESKIVYLPDPIIEIDSIMHQKKTLLENLTHKDFFIMVGRFTKQKNHLLAIRCFKKIAEKKKNINLLIIGNGELKNEYKKEINRLRLNDKIQLVDYQSNIFSYFKNSLGLISSSLWEDPGFVMIEAAACNTFVISSDCPSGPQEFIGTDSGILFKNNNIESLEQKILEFLSLNKTEISRKKINAKKKAINFTKLRHFKILDHILS